MPWVCDGTRLRVQKRIHLLETVPEYPFVGSTKPVQMAICTRHERAIVKTCHSCLIEIQPRNILALRHKQLAKVLPNPHCSGLDSAKFAGHGSKRVPENGPHVCRNPVQGPESRSVKWTLFGATSGSSGFRMGGPACLFSGEPVIACQHNKISHQPGSKK